MANRSTQLDRALQSKALFWGFVGVIGAVTAYSIYNGNLFPQQVEKIEAKAKEVKRDVEKRVEEAKKEHEQHQQEREQQASKQQTSHYSSSRSTTVTNSSSSGAQVAERKVELKGSPEAWSEEDMESWLKSHKVMITGHEGKNELIAMVESTMHAPDFTG